MEIGSQNQAFQAFISTGLYSRVSTFVGCSVLYFYQKLCIRNEIMDFLMDIFQSVQNIFAYK